jgi:hypothetical protein
VNSLGVRALLTKIIGIMIILGGTATVGDAKDASQPAAVPLCSVESTADRMQTDHQEWAAATLRGDQDAAEEHERALMTAVWLDLQRCEEQVRRLARQVTLSRDSSGAALDVYAESEFKDALSNLKAKQALNRSLARTEAFSNKYRLLGDYIYLLRKELGMRPPELATVPKEHDGTTTNAGGNPAK